MVAGVGLVLLNRAPRPSPSSGTSSAAFRGRVVLCPGQCRISGPELRITAASWSKASSVGFRVEVLGLRFGARVAGDDVPLLLEEVLHLLRELVHVVVLRVIPFSGFRGQIPRVLC